MWPVYRQEQAQLQENLVRYADSDHQAMRDVYNRIRLLILQTIRELEDMRETVGGVMDVLALDSLKLLANEEQAAIHRDMTELIARRIITPDMGSSLINDSMFAHDISLNLIRAAQTLFVIASEEYSKAAQDVVLDKSNLDRISEQAGTGNPGR